MLRFFLIFDFTLYIGMQLQVKPRLYADVNKQMDETYYNYEAYEIEYGYIYGIYTATLKTMRLSPKLAKANTLKCTLASIPTPTKML